MKLNLHEVAKVVGAKNTISDFDDVPLRQIEFDSRKIEKGDLFLPLKGARDGHDFIETAFENGAVATFSEREVEGHPYILVDDCLEAFQALASYYLEKQRVDVIAVTGSNGKTTTKDMIAAVLSTVVLINSLLNKAEDLIDNPNRLNAFAPSSIAWNPCVIAITFCILAIISIDASLSTPNIFIMPAPAWKAPVIPATALVALPNILGPTIENIVLPTANIVTIINSNLNDEIYFISFLTVPLKSFTLLTGGLLLGCLLLLPIIIPPYIRRS